MGLLKWFREKEKLEMKVRELRRTNGELKCELAIAKAELQKKKTGQHCKICANSYKKEQTYHMGQIFDGGYGCKLDIACESFKEREEEPNE